MWCCCLGHLLLAVERVELGDASDDRLGLRGPVVDDWGGRQAHVPQTVAVLGVGGNAEQRCKQGTREEFFLQCIIGT